MGVDPGVADAAVTQVAAAPEALDRTGLTVVATGLEKICLALA